MTIKSNNPRTKNPELLTGAKPSADARLAADVAGANPMRLPWLAITGDRSSRVITIVDSSGDILWTTDSEPLAAFIVAAVNSHAALVEASKVLARIIHRATTPMSNGDIDLDDVRAARAALTTAKENA